jgi:hypothetical protein
MASAETSRQMEEQTLLYESGPQKPTAQQQI